jgi:hypothetical protein
MAYLQLIRQVTCGEEQGNASFGFREGPSSPRQRSCQLKVPMDVLLGLFRDEDTVKAAVSIHMGLNLKESWLALTPLSILDGPMFGT